MRPRDPTSAALRLRSLRAWGVLLGAWLLAPTGPACTLELDDGFSCGDGYWNREAGEECDPEVRNSFINACVGTSRPDGTAECDPTTCTIINDLEQCGVCGDGRVDEILGEHCDGDELNGASCPGGVGTLQCSTACRFDTSACRSCGNGTIDLGEECDPNADPSDLVQPPPPCDQITPYYADKPYTSGQPGPCGDDCRWDRSTCGYCNNGELEGEHVLVDDGVSATPEQCDGDEFDPMALETTLQNSVCTIVDADLWPTTRTCEDCFEISFVEDPREPCCVRPGGACPEEGSEVRCCSEVDGPDPDDEVTEPLPERCQTIFTSGVWFDACT
jgi:hypothetical protein